METCDRTSLIHHRTLDPRQFLVTFLLLADLYFSLASASFLPSAEVITRSNSRSKLIENSPIYYLKVSPNLRNNPYNTKGGSLRIDMNNLLGKRTSNLYKLPLQFMSNAKPVDIQGITGKVNFSKVQYKKKKKIFKHSKVFHLSTKFVSNGKPIKPYLLSHSKRKLYSRLQAPALTRA